jgi:CDGSH-type Zn-finger protein/uncharacterized Fe-S cluster protein YjdI
MSKEIARSKAAVIEFDGGKCIHSRHCVLDRPDVFVPNVEGEWIHPEKATPDELVALARNCPSGAIVTKRLDRGAGETAPPVNTVRVLENGPLAFRAELSVRGEAAGFRATLCRCGRSQKKPYCDGSHAGAGFTATGEPPARDSNALTTRGGTLKVMPVKNGPLKVEGPVEVISGTGHTLNRATSLAFCRCGHSKTKPYCDGSHVALGFVAD